MTPADPLALAAFILAAFTLAGVAQTAWFAAPQSRAFAIPLDAGTGFRGRRIFGPNKTLRGFVVMVPAAAAAFACLAAIVPNLETVRLWPISVPSYGLLGAWAGLGFMAGELPNSFIKRQLDIPAGDAPSGSGAIVHFVFDRLDSGIGMLLALAIVIDVPALTWAYVLLIGPFIHWSFSALMFRLGLKGRPA